MSIMISIGHVQEFLHNSLFRYPETRAQYRVRSSLFATLFLIGIVHWIGFFNSGDLSLLAYDWVLEGAFLDTLREAQTSGVIPWRWTDSFGSALEVLVDTHDTRNFLTNPEIVLTPDIIFLRWIPNSIFIIIHVLLFYSVGFVGSILIARKLKASFVAFLFFWLVFNFNGYLTAHLAVGHLPWTGYYLLPFFFIILSRFVTDSKNGVSIAASSALAMGLLLGVLFLNGSFHFAVWCSMFMGIALVWRWSMFLNVIASVFVGVLLGLGRLLPAILAFPHAERPFRSGYPNFVTVIDAFTSLRGHDFVRVGGIFGDLGWWEYDIYVGFVAFMILAVCFAVAIKRGNLMCQLSLFAAAGVFMLLSLGNVHALIAKSQLPFANIDRVSSRFIVMPFILILITAMEGIDDLFRSWPKNSKLAALIGVPFVAYELVLHSLYWRVDRLESFFQPIIGPMLSLDYNPDYIYSLSVYAGWSVSIISMLFVTVLLIREHKAFTRTINR